MSGKELFKLSPIRFCLALGLQIIAAWGEVSVAYILTLQFDAAKNKNVSLFLIWSLLQLVGYLTAFGSYNFAGILWQKLVQNYLHLIRQELTDHYFADEQKHEVSAVQNRLTNDLELLHTDYLNSFRYVAGMLANILGVAFSLVTFQWSLLIACLIFAAVQIYLPKLLDKPLQRATKKVSNANQKYLKTLGDWLVGLTEIRRYFASDKLFKTIAKNSGRLEAAKIEKEKVDQELDYLNQLAYSLGDALIFLLTAFLVVNNWAAFGLIASIGNFSSSLFSSLQGIASYGGRMRAIKELRADIFAARKKLPAKMKNNSALVAGLAIHNLAVDFANGTGVTFPDFQIKAGEKILLTGESGSGKSTLFKLILGELPASRGKIQYFDQQSKEIQPDLMQIVIYHKARCSFR